MQTVYVSYSHAAEQALNPRLLPLLRERLAERTVQTAIIAGSEGPSSDLDTAWEAKWDAICLKSGGGEPISAFLRKIALGDQVILLFSQSYFHSSYCMAELLHVFEFKHNAEILPIVALVPGFDPKEIRLDPVRTIWKEKIKQLEKDGQDTAFARNLLRQFPQVLRWLLGAPDPNHEDNWDNPLLAPDTVEALVDGVIDQLGHPHRPILSFLSEASRALKLESLLNQQLEALRTLDPQSRLAQFPDWLAQELGIVNLELAHHIVNARDREQIVRATDLIHDWLECCAKQQSIHEVDRLAIRSLDEVLGIIAMLWMDLEALQQLICELNHSKLVKKRACVEDTYSGFQLLVAALWNKLARFRIDGGELLGRFQVDLQDWGADPSNFKEAIDQDTELIEADRRLLRQLREAKRVWVQAKQQQEQRTPKSRDALQGAIRTRLGDDPWFIAYPQKYRSLANCEKFSQHMAEEYGDLLVQINEADDPRDADQLQQFALGGREPDALNLGALHERLLASHLLIENISHGH